MVTVETFKCFIPAKNVFREKKSDASQIKKFLSCPLQECDIFTTPHCSISVLISVKWLHTSTRLKINSNVRLSALKVVLNPYET